jgi:hypothetical protein
MRVELRAILRSLCSRIENKKAESNYAHQMPALSIKQTLQPASELMHRSSQLVLLSRIDGDAPRAARISAGRLDSSRAGFFQTFEAAL